MSRHRVLPDLSAPCETEDYAHARVEHNYRTISKKLRALEAKRKRVREFFAVSTFCALISLFTALFLQGGTATFFVLSISLYLLGFFVVWPLYNCLEIRRIDDLFTEVAHLATRYVDIDTSGGDLLASRMAKLVEKKLYTA